MMVRESRVALPLPKLTPDGYLRIERKAEYKSEYFNGEMYAMPVGSYSHNVLCGQLIGALVGRLAGSDCHVCTSDMKVRISENGLCAYPDVTVVCGKSFFTSDQKDVLANPRLIIEVLSDATERKDRGFKFQQYKKVASLEEYVLVSQSEPLIERYRRPPGGVWSAYAEARGLDASLVLESRRLEIPLAEIYCDIEFDPVAAS
jgi:Uma2 family endonuclease